MRGGELLYVLKITDLLLLGILLVSCYTDLKERRILNILVLPGMLLALVLHLAQQGLAGILFWGKGTLAGIALLFIPFVLGGIGAGDVKLLGVVGSFKGAWFAFQTFLCAAILGGLFSLIVLCKEKKLKSTLGNVGKALKVLLFSSFRVINLGSFAQEKFVAIPYGLAIALGAILCLVGEWL